MQIVRRLFDFFQPEHYTLELDLQRETRTFSGTVQVIGRKMSAKNRIVLHAKELRITSVQVDDAVVSFDQAGDELVVTADFPEGNYTVTVIFDGKISDAMHGLYPCYFEVDGIKKELLATQFESHHAREVFPCVDEPEAKATFDLTLITELGVTVLSNVPEKVADGIQPTADRKITKFQTTPRMSTYLLAFVVGELQKTSATSRHGVEVNVWATNAHMSDSLDYALDFATRAVDFYDDYFGTPYPLPKADHVALPDFSHGAMENWGLIAYRESTLLADASLSQESREYIAKVIAHELSHQWFGNLVTMRWWNNLWLNESFARLMEYVCLDALEPDWSVWDDVTMNEGIHALRRDAVDGVQAVQTNVSHPDEIGSLFDGAIVYAKGARLMRILLEYIGYDAFRTGLQAYFKQHAYGNTVANDLWRAMSSASGKDVETLMNAWISQPGYPVVTITESGLEQARFFVGSHAPNDALWPIPLFANDPSLPEIFDTKSLNIAIPDDTLLNTGDRAHFITHYDTARLQSIEKHIAAKTIGPVDRLKILHEQSLLAEAEVVDTAALVPLLLAYKHETEEQVWSMVAATARTLRVFTQGSPDAMKLLGKLYMELVKKPFARLGWHPKSGESASDATLRADILNLVVHSGDQSATAEADAIYHSQPVTDIDANIRVPVLRAVLRRHPEDDTLFETLLSAYKSTVSPELRHDIMYSLSTTVNPTHCERQLQLLTDASTIRPQDARPWFMLLLHAPENQQATWDWLQAHWNWVETVYGGDSTHTMFVQYCGTYLTTARQLAEFRTFFAAKHDQPGLARAVGMAETSIAARVARIEQQTARFINTLKERYDS